MKKLVLLFAGLSLLLAIGCRNDDAEPVFSIVGIWQPLKEVVTKVPVNGNGVSDEITYSTCQKESRWNFNEGATGKRTDRDEVGASAICGTVSDKSFTYNYSRRDQRIEIKYQGEANSDKGKVTRLDATTLNLIIEDTTDPNEYRSTTYTFKRISQ